MITCQLTLNATSAIAEYVIERSEETGSKKSDTKKTGKAKTKTEAEGQRYKKTLDMFLRYYAMRTAMFSHVFFS